MSLYPAPEFLLSYLPAQGVPYNYVVGHDNSTRLVHAPEGSKEAVRRMTLAAKRIVAEEDFVNFNEVLAVGLTVTWALCLPGSPWLSLWLLRVNKDERLCPVPALSLSMLFFD